MGGMKWRPVGGGGGGSVLRHDYSVSPERAGHQLVCWGLEGGKK